MKELDNNPHVLFSHDVCFQILIAKTLEKTIPKEAIDKLKETNDLIFYTPRSFWQQPFYHIDNDGNKVYSICGVHPDYDEGKLPDLQLDKVVRFLIKVEQT